MSEKAVWNIDPSHSVVEFSVRHMMIARVKGRFGTFTGVLTADPADLSDATIKVEVDTVSIDTRDDQRDEHLRSADFFDSENFPKMTFESKQVKKTGDDTYDIEGELTIRDVTRPITLNATMTGQGQDPWGNQRIGFEAKSQLNRRDFGLTWNTALETGGVLVGEDVKIEIEAQFVRDDGQAES